MGGGERMKVPTIPAVEAAAASDRLLTGFPAEGWPVRTG